MNALDSRQEPLADPVEVTLEGGDRIALRRIGSDDQDLLRAGFERLSERSRFLRFMQPIETLTDDYLDAVTRCSDASQFICGALDLSVEPAELIGTARYMALPERPQAAEFAVTVIDSFQSRRLGTLLLGVIACVAQRNGIDEFIGLVYYGNFRMLSLLDELDARREREEGSDVWDFQFPLHADPAEYPDTPAGYAFRRAASLLD